MADETKEVYRAAFTSAPASHLAGIPTDALTLPSPSVAYGAPFTESCARHVKDTFHSSRVYIIASGSLSRNTDELDQLVSAIGPERVAGVRKGITPHTPWSEILQATMEAQTLNADCVVTLGAGSITDCAKIVVLAMANNIQTLDELARYSVESTNPPKTVHEPTIPLITIPTTLSGGEYFSLAGGTDPRTQHKQAFLHSGMGARLVILSPQLSLHTPEYHWLSTGIRSVDHCIEALCSLASTPESDDKASAGLRLLVPGLLKTKQDPTDVVARHHCQMGVMLAMDNIRSGVPMGGSHAIGHQLGPLGVAHGVTSCVLCPAVMRYNWDYGGEGSRIREKQERVVDILWAEDMVAETLEKAGKKRGSDVLGELLDVIIRVLGLPRSLTEVGVKEDVLPALSKRALDDFWAATNPVPLVEAAQVLEILHAAL
ncbi:hypothetical protein FE257_003091 [Aspergillus nanangensis]|uniref:Alcohol dehydrogenase iron-type/glycerol dehydrogenase GldA domain-containing protein n=1 Tax=Aspergillus nanangensis TaxID=2582783 RepID=A0AAD4CCB3_ASPNN|nr:hypothetical protein FE257_003091 [Aspergillus nanangensis]